MPCDVTRPFPHSFVSHPRSVRVVLCALILRSGHLQAHPAAKAVARGNQSLPEEVAAHAAQAAQASNSANAVLRFLIIMRSRVSARARGDTARRRVGEHQLGTKGCVQCGVSASSMSEGKLYLYKAMHRRAIYMGSNPMADLARRLVRPQVVSGSRQGCCTRAQRAATTAKRAAGRQQMK